MPEIYAHPGRYTTPERETGMGRTWVRSQAAVDLEPGPAAEATLMAPAPESTPVSKPADPAHPADRAPRLPYTPPMVEDVNLVTVAEHEYVPQGMDAPTHGSRLLAQVRRSWAVSKRRSTG